ncbi:ATP-grasp domain-containing protein [Rhodoligotrophos defluvii]|uniref:ATP-grasp domain-containing protein n=1 Tax=Rhodoligotrophos defluvii TaxID=2561934 RepID=UPI0010C986A9|nr:ATP-grasp domain-containing protein [Rhodoligotrophos defluvii]
MNLLEAEGKALIARHGIAVPRGALWPELPETEGALVVKAQVPTGRRGKAGGIRFAAGHQQAESAAKALLGMEIGGHRANAVYVEERLEILHEHYLAVALDRDRRCHLIIASPKGGMDIEEVDEHHILRLPIDPLLGLRSFHADCVARFLTEDGHDQTPLSELVASLYRAVVAVDAELIEINPLAVTPGGLVAADAKVILDDNARFRHPEWPDSTDRTDRSTFERAAATAGAVGVEVDPEGDTVAVVSGAGLMMATLDLLADAGLKVRAVIDLGGTVLSGADGLQQVLSAVAPLNPRVTFLNAFMQTAFCDVFAEGLAGAHASAPLPGRIVVRLKGRRADVGRARLQPLGFEIHEDLEPAIAALVPGRRT